MCWCHGLSFWFSYFLFYSGRCILMCHVLLSTSCVCIFFPTVFDRPLCQYVCFCPLGSPVFLICSLILSYLFFPALASCVLVLSWFVLSLSFWFSWIAASRLVFGLFVA